MKKGDYPVALDGLDDLVDFAQVARTVHRLHRVGDEMPLNSVFRREDHIFVHGVFRNEPPDALVSGLLFREHGKPRVLQRHQIRGREQKRPTRDTPVQVWRAHSGISARNPRKCAGYRHKRQRNGQRELQHGKEVQQERAVRLKHVVVRETWRRRHEQQAGSAGLGKAGRAAAQTPPQQVKQRHGQQQHHDQKQDHAGAPVRRGHELCPEARIRAQRNKRTDGQFLRGPRERREPAAVHAGLVHKPLIEFAERAEVVQLHCEQAEPEHNGAPIGGRAPDEGQRPSAHPPFRRARRVDRQRNEEEQPVREYPPEGHSHARHRAEALWSGPLRPALQCVKKQIERERQHHRLVRKEAHQVLPIRGGQPEIERRARGREHHRRPPGQPDSTEHEQRQQGQRDSDRPMIEEVPGHHEPGCQAERCERSQRVDGYHRTRRI